MASPGPCWRPAASCAPTPPIGLPWVHLSRPQQWVPSSFEVTSGRPPDHCPWISSHPGAPRTHPPSTHPFDDSRRLFCIAQVLTTGPVPLPIHSSNLADRYLSSAHLTLSVKRCKPLSPHICDCSDIAFQRRTPWPRWELYPVPVM